MIPRLAPVPPLGGTRMPMSHHPQKALKKPELCIRSFWFFTITMGLGLT